jgi:prophage antirepressor-like protein
VYIRWETVRDACGRPQSTRLLTEAGAYRYLLQSKRPLAEPFQLYVFDLLKAERKRTVDNERLARKIEQTRHEEQVHALKRQITICKWEMDGLMTEIPEPQEKSSRGGKVKWTGPMNSGPADEDRQSRYFWPK